MAYLHIDLAVCCIVGALLPAIEVKQGRGELERSVSQPFFDKFFLDFGTASSEVGGIGDIPRYCHWNRPEAS
jgi:hypothetical protein